MTEPVEQGVDQTADQAPEETELAPTPDQEAPAQAGPPTRRPT